MACEGGLPSVHVVNRDAGFTLIELMIAVAIVTIATALAVPNFLRWYAQFELRQATSEIATQLILARMAGMNRNRGVVVTVQTVGALAHISAVTSDVSPVSVINDKSLPGAPSVVGSPVTVSFSSMGLRTSGGTGTQTIGVCDAYKRQYSVTIIPTGKVNWSVDNLSGIPCP
jgi:prepilin-type N-terminal cleavage/methylation domain-containing protein